MNTGQLIQKLIAIPSVTGKEKKIQKYIEKYIKAIGLSPVWVGSNLVVCISGNDTHKAILFNAHVDTVSAGDEKNWKDGPLEGVMADGKVYGLGASDEKSTVATLLLLAEALVKKKPACDVWLTFVVNEEMDGSGSAEVVKWFVKNHKKSYVQVATILGEPTNLSKIEIGHKGNVFLKVTTYGDSGHGSKPYLITHHAVEEMFGIAIKLQQLENQWKKKYSDPILGSPTIGRFTSITAGVSTSPNKFPDSCVATFDIRTTPALHDSVLLKVKHALGTTVDVDFVYPPVGCGYTDPKELIVTAMKKATHVPVGIFSMGSCDMPFFTAAGIPAVIFGPGEPQCCHKPDEYCQVSNIERCVGLYEGIIELYSDKKYE